METTRNTTPHDVTTGNAAEPVRHFRLDAPTRIVGDTTRLPRRRSSAGRRCALFRLTTAGTDAFDEIAAGEDVTAGPSRPHRAPPRRRAPSVPTHETRRTGRLT